MSIHNFSSLFSPSSVALVGASATPNTVGNVIAANLLNGGFKGEIYFVNPLYSTILGHPCYPSIETLPAVPALAVIATPAVTVPEIIGKLAARGTHAAVIISAGIREAGLQQEMLAAAHRSGMRIVGPNCLGIAVPSIGLNASFAQLAPQNGNIAFISQSGALVGAVLDWAATREIGFSAVVSAGDMADADIGDFLDYFASDAATSAVLLYLEQVTAAPKFMSAARACARLKPVVVVKSGRHPESAKAAKSHTGALAGEDNVYDAAFHRAGIVRVAEMEDLFDAAEMLSRARLANGDRLAILTNGGGAGVLAVDRLLDCGGRLAVLSRATIDALANCLPHGWSQGNPVDILGDAKPERYEAAMKAMLDDPGVDAILVMNCPVALSPGAAAAGAVIRAAATKPGKAVITAWLGGEGAAMARQMFASAGIPTHESPDDAVRAFMYLTEYHRAQELLMRTPPASPRAQDGRREKGAALIAEALARGRDSLTEWEGKTLLASYGIPVVPTYTVRRTDEVKDAAASMLTGSVTELVLKINSPDIIHKTDVGGVALGLTDPEVALRAAEEMYLRIRKASPKAHIDGFTLQPMIRKRNARELIIGMSEDVTFGPVILFGAGGTSVEVIRDRAIGLPPLDIPLALDLISRTAVSRMLGAHRDKPQADREAIARALVSLSQMIADFPEIAELDINPLLADENGVLALDARVIVRAAPHGGDGLNPRLAIRAYPAHLQCSALLRNGMTLSLRPIRPEDERLYPAFLSRVTPDDLRERFFSSRHVDHALLAKLTQIDYAREMAFVAIDPAGEMLGVARLALDTGQESAEFAVLVRSDLQHQGIGAALLKSLLSYADKEKLVIWGYVHAGNIAMLSLCRNAGFSIAADGMPLLVRVTRPLSQDSPVNQIS